MVKITKEFVIIFLISFLVVIVGNVTALSLDFYSNWMGWMLGGFVLGLLGLFISKKVRDKARLEVKVASRFVKKEEELHPTLFKVLHFLILLIPVAIIGYLLYANFIQYQEFNYFYDIGGVQDTSKPYLSPAARVSEIYNDGNVTYRNLTANLVYFEVPVPLGSERVIVETKLKGSTDNFSILMGAKNKQEWSYLSKTIYNPILESLDLTGKITRINKSMPKIYSIDQIPTGAMVATDLDNLLKEKKQNLDIKEDTFDHALRGTHVFYVYLNDSLVLYTEKRDINWYNGSDELRVSLYNLEGNILGNTTLTDDGVTDTSRLKSVAISGNLTIKNLPSGVYRLEFSGNSDTIITKIKLNTNKIVTNNIFTADSSNYLNDKDKQVEFYVKSTADSQVDFVTYHQDYAQNIVLNNKILQIKERAVNYKFNISSEDMSIIVPRGDVILDSTSYLTFSKDNYFEPLEYYVVPIPSNFEMLSYVDYIVLSDYVPISRVDEDMIARVNLDIKDLYIKDNKLSLMINVPQLVEKNNETEADSLSVDWINITIQKNGIF